MRRFFKKILSILKSTYGRLFESDMDVMSPEARRIFANPEDRKKYIDAIERIKNRESPKETITLSDGEEITMVCY